MDDDTGIANFSLLSGGYWDDIYHRSDVHKTKAFRMLEGDEITSFSGKWSNNGGALNVLEAEFDLSLLSLLNSSVVSTIHTYLTISCVNDEVYIMWRLFLYPQRYGYLDLLYWDYQD